MRKLLIVGLMAVSTTSVVHAAPAVDQVNIAPATQPNGDPMNMAIANLPPIDFDFAGLQFVTAGVSGNLSRVDLQLAKLYGNIGAGRLVIGKDLVFDSAGQVESGTNLGEISFAVSSIGDFNNLTSFDTSGLNIFLNAGDQFVLAVLPSQDSFEVFRWAFGGNAYAGGAGFVGRQPTATTEDDYTWIESDDKVIPRDYGFRTWMNAVPEPASWAMMVVGFGAIGGAMRRRRMTVAMA
jgi:hypothetical protein